MSPGPLTAASCGRLSVTYRLTITDGRAAEVHAEEIALEQSVEIPGDCVPPSVRELGIVGRIESLTPVPGSSGQFDAVISFLADLTAFSLPQLLNVLFGNISIKRGIRIIRMELPDTLLQAIGGPQFGIAGIRRLTGTLDRPLACTALKPLGLSVKELAVMSEGYARGGLDLIKEDHGMADLVFHPFGERVCRCQEAIARANQRTGGRTLYFPMVSGRFDQLESQFALLRQEGIPGVLVAPMLIGLDTVRTLARRYGLAVMAHPAFTGTHFHDLTHGMTPAILLGTLFRLMGADISVFPNFGGRFSFTRNECLELAEALRQPLGSLAPALPAPAGGMKFENIGAMRQTYGVDTMLLIGGALLQHSPDPELSAAAFMEALRAVSPA